MDVFFIIGEDVLEKYNSFWDRVISYVKKLFDTELVYN